VISRFMRKVQTKGIHGNTAKRDMATVERWEHVEQAWRLRSSRLTIRQIASAMKASVGAVSQWLNAYKAEAANRAGEAAFEGRLEGISLCNDMIRGLVATGATQGNEKKATALLHVLQRKADYLGCDAPKELRQKLTIDPVAPITVGVADIAELIKTAYENEAATSNAKLNGNGGNGIVVHQHPSEQQS
jgi:hypothetical protein